MLLKAIENMEIIDDFIRSGRLNLAKNALTQMAQSPRKIPRESLVKVAGLCRRAGCPSLGIRLLRRIVRPASSTRLRHPATPAEMTEYAALLLRLGARAEALRLLVAVDSSRAPQSLLIQAFAQFGKWDYESATPLLEKYVESTGITDYERLIGESNLVSAYVETKHPRAYSLLNEVKVKARDAKANLLYGNLLAAEAEYHVGASGLAEAARAIKEAKQLLGETENIETLNLDKLGAVIEKSPERLTGIAENLRKAGAWENARDCLFQKALLTNDSALFEHLYFGTPHVRYRERIQSLGYCLNDNSYVLRLKRKEHCEARFNLPSLFLEKNDFGQSQISEIDVQHAEGPFKRGQLPHRLLLCLVSDFYRPIRTPEIFDKVFPGQYYNPSTSPALVHQAMHRLRQLFTDSSWPLKITDSEFGFYLSTETDFKIRVDKNGTLNSEDIRIRFAHEKLALLAQSQQFLSRSEIQKTLGLERCSALRMIKKLIDAGVLSAVRAGPRTVYRSVPGPITGYSKSSRE
jgi:hypothetical protein